MTEKHANTDLCRAAAYGEPENVKRLLDQGADVNAQDGKYGNALQTASERGEKEVIHMLLNKGADVNAQDGFFGNALQAASAQGYIEVVQMLLNKGADVNAQSEHYGNALYAASAQGHKEVVQMLLNNGADVNAQDGKYDALYAASFRGKKEVVQMLLDKGADVNAPGGYYGNALYAASAQGHKEVVQILLNKGADVNAQDGKYGALYAASFYGNKEVVQMLLNKGADVNAQNGKYGNALYAASLHDHKEVVQMLLNKGAIVNAQSGYYGNALQTASSQGHMVLQALLNEGADVNEPHGHIDASTLRSMIKTRDVEAIHGLLEQAFDDVAKGEFEWLHELLAMENSKKEIAKLLVEEQMFSPWITFVPPPERSTFTISTNLHQLDCVHQISRKLTTTALPTEGGAELSQIIQQHQSGSMQAIDAEFVKRAIAESCGIAGIRPISLDQEAWVGHVLFEPEDDTSVSVTYELQGRAGTSDNQDFLSRIETAIECFFDIVAWLQETKLCCNSFTILAISKKLVPRAVELVPITFSSLQHWEGKISQLISGDTSIETMLAALKMSQEMLMEIYLIDREDFDATDWESASPDQIERLTIHRCSLVVQTLCLGLLSYSNAHISELQPFFLESTIERISFLGIETVTTLGPVFLAEPVMLTCLGTMVSHPVLAFVATNKPVKGQRLDLLASAEDLLDLWGPGQFILDPSSPSSLERKQLIGIEIGGGCIQSSTDDHNTFHWQKGFFDSKRQTARFDSKSKVRIGATKYNSLCPLDQTKCVEQSNARLENLGTMDGFWEAAERQIGLQAGQYLIAQANQLWVKSQGKTLKDVQLGASDSINVQFLESFWGLQISFCTGVARRVPVREMLADVMAAYVGERFPTSRAWDDMLKAHDVLNHFRGNDLKVWLPTLSQDKQNLLAQLVHGTLATLRDTGYDRTQEEFVIAWPLVENPFRCFRIHCDEGHTWTRALADSVDCATFAYITTKCLETDDCRCRNQEVAQWRNSAVSLDTTVCQHLLPSDRTPEENFIWRLERGATYFIGRADANLVATVQASTSRIDTRLFVKRATIPRSIRERLKKGYRIRERQDFRMIGTPVLILTRK